MLAPSWSTVPLSALHALPSYKVEARQAGPASLHVSHASRPLASTEAQQHVQYVPQERSPQVKPPSCTDCTSGTYSKIMLKTQLSRQINRLHPVPCWHLLIREGVPAMWHVWSWASSSNRGPEQLRSMRCRSHLQDEATDASLHDEQSDCSVCERAVSDAAQRVQHVHQEHRPRPTGLGTDNPI